VYLNQTLPDRWIGRGGPMKWPTRSPDLTLSDYFLSLGFKKIFILISTRKTSDLEQLKHRIVDAVPSIPPTALENVFSEFD